MRRRCRLALVIMLTNLVLLAGFALASSPSPTRERPTDRLQRDPSGEVFITDQGRYVAAAVSADGNYLRNGGMEGSFSYRHDPYTGIWAGELEVADGWGLWYDNNQQCPPDQPDCNPLSYNRRPEYKPERGTARVRTGQASQKFFTTYGTHTAGLYQVLEVPPGSWVRFSIWVWVWSSNRDNPQYSFVPGAYRVSVGFDAEGGNDWRSTRIQWTKPVVAYDQWVPLEIEGYTASGRISVWTRGAPLYPVKHNDSYWDDARLVVLPAPPDPTPTLPTATPYPTPAATPPGGEPPPCSLWRPAWSASFAADLADWHWDAGLGRVVPLGSQLLLTNRETPADAFALAWLAQPLPEVGDYQLSLRVAFPSATAYGTTVGVGSHPYEGQRTLAGSPDRYGLEDILRIHQSTAHFRIDLLGQTYWHGQPGDSTPHHVTLDVRETPYGPIAYTLTVDDVEVGRAVSYWRPQSLYAGNPVVMWHSGYWTEVRLDEVSLSSCINYSHAYLPLALRNYGVVPTATPVVPTIPPDTATPTNTATPMDTATPTVMPSLTPSMTATATPTVTLMPSVTPEPDLGQGVTPSVTLVPYDREDRSRAQPEESIPPATPAGDNQLP
jgi:hypothetical protein